MRLTSGDRLLTYCTNVHAAESLSDVVEALERFTVPIGRRAAPGDAFGVGLRLGAAAADELSRPRQTEKLRAWLEARRLYVFTLNGFPFGDFHGPRVKEAVYAPDWRSEARLGYTDRLADILAVLLPDGMEGSISTVPGAFSVQPLADDERADIARRLARHAERLVRIRRGSGRVIRLGLEPEPGCLLETARDVVDFFEEYVFRYGAIELARRLGDGPASAEQLLREHIGVCWDACHAAVEYEDPGQCLDELVSAGVRIVKLQISSALEVAPTEAPAAKVLLELKRFAEDRYLHQVVERRDGVTIRRLDLPDAIEATRRGGLPDACRVHFHVPIFRDHFGSFRSTQRELLACMHEVQRRDLTKHFEVETYTWNVLPPEHRADDLRGDIVRELAWARERLEAT